MLKARKQFNEHSKPKNLSQEELFMKINNVIYMEYNILWQKADYKEKFKEFLEFHQIYGSKCVSQECFVLPHNNSSRTERTLRKNLLVEIGNHNTIKQETFKITVKVADLLQETINLPICVRV